MTRPSTVVRMPSSSPHAVGRTGRGAILASAAIVTAGLLSSAEAQDDLAGYFGFSSLEIVAIGTGAGPFTTADMDGDGLEDLVVVNNHDSRIEIHLQRRGARPEFEPTTLPRPNEFPEHWRFRRILVPVTHHVAAVVPFDADGDGLQDLVYAGYPGEIVFVRQKEPGHFEIARRHRQRRLAANRDGFAIADLQGDERPDLLALMDGAIHVWSIEGRDGMELGPPTRLSAGDGLVAFLVEDFDGDGHDDLVGILPDDAAPVRLWLASTSGDRAELGPQLRFEMPPIREAAALRLPGVDAARLAVIEGPSKRIVVAKLDLATIDAAHASTLLVHGFATGADRQRAHAVADLDGDGREDLVVTDPDANAILVYRQRSDGGFDAGVSHPSLSDLAAIAAGNCDQDTQGEVFVMSEKEGVVGRTDAAGVTSFPQPLEIETGSTPTAIAVVTLDGTPHLAVATKNGREYALELLDLEGGRRSIGLGKQSRSPDTIIDLDADQDGRTDLLLFTEDKPMIMVHANSTSAGDESGFTLLESDAMGQYGLVKAASSDNVAVHDIDGDGHDELLLADRNFVRAVRYDDDPAPSVAAGWQVVAQINVEDDSSRLVSLAVLESRIVAADRANDRLVVLDGDTTSGWTETTSIPVTGFGFDAIHAGAFGEGGAPGLLAVGAEAFAVVRLEGERFVLRETDAWRTSFENRLEHELAVGDLNSDGFADMVSLDAGEQMCELFTFTERGRMVYATGFQVFESRIFSGGDVRQFEPSMAVIADLTGDGADDLALLSHDRVLLYPQMKEPGVGDRE